MHQEIKGFGGTEKKVKSKDEGERMLKDITKQNATLRRKLDDATQKIETLEKRK